MNGRGATQGFRFWGCSQIRESLGVRADSERQLLERIESVPADSIYHHSVRSLLRRQVVQAHYASDFANWVLVEVRDAVLAERLALASPFEFPDLEAFREHLLATLDDHLSRLPFGPRALLGSPFYFLRSHLAAIPLDLEVHDLAGLARALAEVDDGSIYYHAVEAEGRLGRPHSDFAAWVGEALELPGLAARLADVDPFVGSLDAVRSQLRAAVDAHLRRGA